MTSVVCTECLNELNRYDEFQHSSQLIQATICATYQNTRSEVVYVKQELISDNDDDSPEYSDEYSEPEDPKTEQDVACKEEPEDDDEMFHTQVKPSLPPIKLNFRCDKCRHRTDSRIKLEFHMLSAHSDKGPFKCPACSKVFHVKASFSRHFYDHKEDANVLCPT